MKPTIKYIWSWQDDEGTYLNTACSLEEIISEITEYYFDEIISSYKCEVKSEIVMLFFTINAKEYTFTCDHNPYEVGRMLQEIANLDSREDKFIIKSVSSVTTCNA